MPTYTFKCQRCGAGYVTMVSIREYCATPPAFMCCGEKAERFFEVVPGLALHNALAGERHYEGLAATDGTPIDSRAKHQQYMRSRGLTTADDFKFTWAQAAKEREARMAGVDKTRADDVAQAVTKLEG